MYINLLLHHIISNASIYRSMVWGQYDFFSFGRNYFNSERMEGLKNFYKKIYAAQLLFCFVTPLLIIQIRNEIMQYNDF